MTILIYVPIGVYTVYLGGLPFFIMMLLMVFLALQEMYAPFNLKYKKTHDIFYYGYMFTTIFLVSVYMKEIQYVWENVVLMMIIFTTISLFIFELFCKKLFWATNPFAYLIRSIVYVGIMSCFMFLVRNLPNGVYYFLFLIGVVAVNDTFAYLIGLPFGRHKLLPTVSPKKSIEGAIGALLGAVLMSVCLQSLIKATIFEAIALGIVLSLLAQLGDLVESLLKRELQVKDSGTVFPGHGGVLDRLDSFILTFPVFYYFVIYFVK
jgi:phosphatidate cytidylyltransferase